MVRNVLGSVLALIGATAAVWSPFRVWYDGRLGREYPVGDLFSGTGVTAAKAELFGSLFLPFVVAAVVTLVGIALRSRGLVALAGVIVLGFAALWMVRLGLEQGSLTVGGTGAGPGLGPGVAGAVGGGAVLLLASLVMPGRKRRRGRRRRTTPLAPAEPTTAVDRSRAPEDQPRDEHTYPEPEAPTTRPAYEERSRAVHDERAAPSPDEPTRPVRAEPSRPAQDEPTRPIWRQPPDQT